MGFVVLDRDACRVRQAARLIPAIFPFCRGLSTSVGVYLQIRGFRSNHDSRLICGRSMPDLLRPPQSPCRESAVRPLKGVVMIRTFLIIIAFMSQFPTWG